MWYGRCPGWQRLPKDSALSTINMCLLKQSFRCRKSRASTVELAFGMVVFTFYQLWIVEIFSARLAAVGDRHLCRRLRSSQGQRSAALILEIAFGRGCRSQLLLSGKHGEEFGNIQVDSQHSI